LGFEGQLASGKISRSNDIEVSAPAKSMVIRSLGAEVPPIFIMKVSELLFGLAAVPLTYPSVVPSVRDLRELVSLQGLFKELPVGPTTWPSPL